MSNEHAETLREVFSEVVENLAFMFTEIPDEDEFPEPEGATVRASMHFKGPFTGALYMAVPEAMCPEIAANVLGLDPEDELVLAQPYDALKEMLNVVCGNLLPVLAGEEPVFDLTVPEVEQLSDDAWQDFRDDEAVEAFIVDDNPVLLKLSLNA